MFPFVCFKPLLFSSFCYILKNKAASTVITSRLEKSFASQSLKLQSSAAPGSKQHADHRHNWYFYLAAFWDSVLFAQHRSGLVQVELIVPDSKGLHSACELPAGDMTKPPSSALPEVNEQPSWGVNCYNTRGDNFYGNTSKRRSHCIPVRLKEEKKRTNQTKTKEKK